MADENQIKSNLEQLAKEMQQRISDLREKQNEAGRRGDLASINNLRKLIALQENYNKSLIKQNDLEKKLNQKRAEGQALTDDEIKAWDRAKSAADNYQRQIKSVDDSVRKSIAERKRKTKEFEKELIDLGRNGTLAGKALGTAFDVAGSAVSRLVGGIGIAMQAQKALNLLSEAAVLQAELRVKAGLRLAESFDDQSISSKEAGRSFRDYASVSGMASAGVSTLGKALGVLSPALGQAYEAASKNNKGLTDTMMGAYRLSATLADTKAAVVALGGDASQVAGIMSEFSEIAGTRNPAALSLLTKSAVAAAKSMGITTAEAVEFAATRVEKFGGSAASATAHLFEIREEVLDINEAFGKQIIRAGDLVRSIKDISQASVAYAIDQRSVSNVLKDSIVRLQVLGSSYRQAQDAAKAYTEAVTGERVPEFMKAMAGTKLVNIFQQAMAAGKGVQGFMDEFGAELDRAAPGLSKKVLAVLQDPFKDAFTKSQQIQELTAGTTVGMSVMNKQIVDLGKTSLFVLKEQLQLKSLTEAQNVFDAAKMQLEKEKEINNALRMRVDDYKKLSKEYGIQEETAKKILAMDNKDPQKRLYLETLVTQKKMREGKIEMTLTDAQRREKNKKDRAALEQEIKELIAKKEEAARKNNAVEMALYEDMIKRKQEAMAALEEPRADVIRQQIAEKTQQLKITTDEKERKKLIEEIEKLKLELGAETMPPEYKALNDAFQRTFAENAANLITDPMRQLQVAVESLGTVGWALVTAAGALTGALLLRKVSDKIMGKLGETLLKRMGGGGGGAGGILGTGGFRIPPMRGPTQISEAQRRQEANWMRGERMDQQSRITNTARVASGMFAGAQIYELLKNRGQGASLENLYTGLKATAGALGMLGGPVGALSRAFVIGSQVGEQLNEVFKQLGFSGRDTMYALSDWVEKMTDKGGIFSKFGEFISGGSFKSAKQKEEELGGMLQLQREQAASRYGMSLAEYEAARKKAQEQGISVSRYLQQQGKAPAAPAAPTGAIPTRAGAEANRAAEQAAMAQGAAGAAAANAGTPLVGAETGALIGQFGPVNADGSVNIVIQNFMSAFADANEYRRRNIRPT